MDQWNAEPSTRTDADIVDAVRHGDVQAYGELVRRYERGVLAIAWPIVRDAHAARDVVQEAFIQCFLKIATLRDGSRFGAWLMKAARRQAIRTARIARRAPLKLSRTEPPAPEGLRVLDDEATVLLDRVRRLPAHESLVITLRFFEGHDVRHIAQITGRPVGTVTKQLSRAIERLRADPDMESHLCPTRKSMIA
jgi:RNA polymerase sigma-70 factor (ECF subfamily)